MSPNNIQATIDQQTRGVGIPEAFYKTRQAPSECQNNTEDGPSETSNIFLEITDYPLKVSKKQSRATDGEIRSRCGRENSGKEVEFGRTYC